MAGSPYEGSTTAVVTETPVGDNGLCARHAEFVVDDVTYVALSPSKVTAYCDDVGSTVTAQYRPERPEASQVKDGWPLAAFDYLGPALGSLSFGAGGLRLLVGRFAAVAANPGTEPR